jgi:hypothetical protein
MKNISGSITSGGTAQALFNLSAQPYKGYWLRNNSAESIWIYENGTATAAQPSLEIKSGELYETPPNCGLFTEALSIIAATTGTNWTGRVW